MLLYFIQDTLLLMMGVYILSRFVDAKKFPVFRTIILFGMNVILMDIWYPDSFKLYIDLSLSVFSLLFLVYWLHYFTKSIIDSLVIYCLCSIYRLIISIPLGLVFSFLFPDEMMKSGPPNFTLGIILIAFIMITTYFIDRKWPLVKFSIKVIELKPNIKLVIVSIFMCYHLLTDIVITYTNHLVSSTSLLDILFFYTEVLLAFFVFRSYKQNQLAQEKSLFYNQYVEGVYHLLDDYQQSYLDHKKHLETFSSDSFTVTNDHSHFSNLSQLKNKVLAAFLYAQTLEAKKVGVQIALHIESSMETCTLSNYQIIEIFGIVVNNAIEAAKNTQDGAVNLLISDIMHPSSYKKTYNVSVSNSCMPLSPSDIQNLFKKGFSSKNKHSDSKRGIGLYKLKQLMHHRGELNVEYHETSSTFEIQLSFS